MWLSIAFKHLAIAFAGKTQSEQPHQLHAATEASLLPWRTSQEPSLLGTPRKV